MGNKQCVVYANDLNPASFKYLKQNVAKNEVGKYVRCSNLCARVFWKELCGKKDEVAENGKGAFINHVIMNLPATALEFLDIFKECFTEKEVETYGLPQIHCYCFAKIQNYKESIVERVRKYLGAIPIDLKIRLVRNIAPYKNMYCVSFKLPKEIAIKTE